MISIEMPKYKCHKEVWALKIKKIEKNQVDQGSATIYPEDLRYGAITVDANYVTKHNPQEGGYYVVYKDGYESFSPAESFEEGYSKI